MLLRFLSSVYFIFKFNVFSKNKFLEYQALFAKVIAGKVSTAHFPDDSQFGKGWAFKRKKNSVYMQ